MTRPNPARARKGRDPYPHTPASAVGASHFGEARKG
jgi:hypothetical protein